VPPEHAEIGSTVLIEVRTQKLKAQVVPTPFYKRPKK
jgi:aminomethyltransferase